MAISTATTTLSYSTDGGTTYTELCPITGYPDLGSTPTKLDTTDLSATKYKTYILGLQEIPDLTFEANYDEAKYSTISALTATYKFKLAFGASDGIFTWDGKVQIYPNGGGVDEVRKMTIVTSAESAITFATVA